MLNRQLGTYTKKTHRKASEQPFHNRWPLSHSKLTKTMKTYIRFNRHKNSTPKINQIEPQQKYRLVLNYGGGGGGVKLILQGPNLTLISSS